MDSFTQGIIERAEKRSKALGITSTSGIPLGEFNHESCSSSSSSVMRKPSSPRKLSGSPTKQNRETTRIVKNFTTANDSTSSDDSKENVDLAVEIFVTTTQNVEVDVQVAECEIDADGNITKQVNKTGGSIADSGIAESRNLIRDTSRNRLQRLGTLYSDNQDLSSPIHRTEARFHESLADQVHVGRQMKLGKLAALAKTINNWEDDPSHPDYKHHRDTVYENKSPTKQSPKATSPSKQSPTKPKGSSPKLLGATPKKPMAPQPPKSILLSEKPQDSGEKSPTKQLKWDRKIMDSLESQGFKRRESNMSKLTYNYAHETQDNANNKALEKQPTESPKKVVEAPAATQSKFVEPKKAESPKKVEPNRSGLVSGRAALFESSKSLSPKKNSKDPTELSLKDRMAIFEKNKGTALVPKAPFGMAASIKQIQQERPQLKKTADKFREQPQQRVQPTEQESKSPQQQRILTYNQPVLAESKAAGFGIQKTMEALMSGGTTISESQIAEENRRQRQQEMDILLNRFHKNNKKNDIPSAPPMPPPDFFDTQTRRQSHVEANTVVISNKRRSDERSLDEPEGGSQVSPEVRSALDDVKRIRVAAPKHGRLYPTLSDIESTATESDQDNYTTATASGTDEQQDVEKEYRFHEPQRGDEEYTDNENDDSYMDSEDGQLPIDDICNGSLGREIMRAVQRNEPFTSNRSFEKPTTSHNRSAPNVRSVNSSNSEMSDVLAEMDDYLDEALEEDEDSDEQEKTPKGSMSSNSFSYEKNPRSKQVHYQKIDEECDEETDDDRHRKHRGSPKKQDQFRSPVKSELQVNPSDDNDLVTLVHTVSFYRRQQQLTSNSASNTPIRKVTRGNDGHDHRKIEFMDDSENDSEADRRNEDSIAVQEKVKKLLDEVCKQQTVISQTSQALNLCAATIEFSGSTESVEGERHLLVATNRRQACLDEVQRLRVEGCIRPSGLPKEKGRLTVREITVPLRQDYIRKLASDAISGHHLVCLLKYNENVLATKTVPTLPGLLSVKFPDVLNLNNVYADFKITMEIYGMTAQREVLPHDIKYHIGTGKSKANKMLTPKGKKGSDSRLFRPPVQSPAGPHAVRTPGLVQYGFIIFSLREIGRTSWTMNPVAGISPLEGTVHMKVNCELSVNVDHRGFLTMFEDVSGFGAWHRRWCHLNGQVINYWKYPDDEKKKTPMGTFDLQNCSTRQVGLAPRDICARLNTMLLECQRPSHDSDIESQVLVKQGRVTTIRFLLSADTKEEREEWCTQLNKTLALMRAWGKRGDK